MSRGAFETLDPAAYALPAQWARRALTPALVVYLDRVRDNVARVLAHCGHDAGRWRPHVKSAKIPAVLCELVRAGVRHFKCATTREAAVLLETLEREGAVGDVLVAVPHVGPALERLADLARRHGCARGADEAARAPRLSVLCEDPEGARAAPEPLGLFLDLNSGMDRTGLSPDRGDALLDTARAAGARLRGVHAYDGHHHHLDRSQRRRAIHADYARLADRLTALVRAGCPLREVVSAGTPAFLDALAFEGFGRLSAGLVHRVSPGTVIYHDLRSQEETPELGLTPAALVFARVVSRPRPDRATLDAGSKSLAVDAGHPCAAVLGHPEWTPQVPSEEHLPVAGAPAGLPARGALLALIPRHVCPTVNLFESAALMDGGCWLGVVPVAARGHELIVEAPGAAPMR